MSHLRNFHWLIVAAHGDRVTVIMESAPWWIGCIMQPDQPMELERGWHGGVSAHTGSAALPTVQPKVGAPLTQPAGGAAQSPNGAPSTAQSPSVAPVLRAQTPSAAAAQTPVATLAATGSNPTNKTRAPRTPGAKRLLEGLWSCKLRSQFTDLRTFSSASLVVDRFVFSSAILLQHHTDYVCSTPSYK